MSGAAAKVLELESDLNLHELDRILSFLATHRHQGIALDASKVAWVGTPCLQGLLSAAKTWRADGAWLEVVKPSSVMVAALRTLGLSLDDLSSTGTES